jgi:hypothetical protein
MADLANCLPDHQDWLWRAHDLPLAKILSDREIKRLHTFRNPAIC